MSEELDLTPNNLCIPEDAFEKFQAVSMYQEKEYIVLPQSVPPKTNSPEPRAVSPPLVDNEVVVSSENVLSSPLNSTEIDSSAEKSLLHGLEDGSTINNSTPKPRQSRRNSNRRINYNYDNDMVISSSEFGNATIRAPTTNSTTPRKRGRKPKKSSPEELPAEVSQNIQNPDISSTPFSSDLDSSDTNAGPQKKRGRPRKIDSESLSEAAISDREISNAPSTDNIRTEESTTITQRRGRQRRSKVISTNAPTQNELESEEPIPVLEEPPQPATEPPNLATVPTKQTKSKLPSATPKSKQSKTTAVKSKQSKLKAENEQLNMAVEEPTLAAEQAKALEQPSNEDLIQLSDLDIVEVSNCDDISKTHKSTEESRATNLNTTDLEDYESKLESENKMLNDNAYDSDLDDDVCLSKLKTTPDQSNRKTDGDIKNTSSDNIDGNSSKPKKRRGRPKKETFGGSLSQMIENKLEGDDVSICKLNNDGINMEPKTEALDIQVDEIQQSTSGINGTPNKRNTKVPVMADFEYNIDSVIGNETAELSGISADDPLLTEDPSKRPTRRRVKNFKYEEESDEDPFANVELSDDEPRRGRKAKYYSDDEYVPGQQKGKRRAAESSESEDISDADERLNADDMLIEGRRKSRNNQSPRKKGKKDEFNPKISDITSLEQTDDIEGCLEPSIIKSGIGEPSKWGTTTEFENFLAKKIQGTNLKIKKVSSGQASKDNNKMDIPVMAADAKKSIEMYTQTTTVATTSTGVQTSSLYDTTMKDNIVLTPDQSEKACSFLNSIVKTTAELGHLMTQKSEDFMKKKINTTHVTDTSKMDYCVKKSFLLFKLAKHNLLQMEEDLAKQYDEFLKTNGLESCIEKPKAIKPTPKKTKNADSDSDCEIVDVAPSANSKPVQKSNAKAKFNPKTVFLNKELSIKIAKKTNDNQKPTDAKQLDIKGRHTVWINDTVMVKKVKPTQSFLAQDSRNKKPPDYPITTEMVSVFFKDYFRQKAVTICAPFVTTDWLSSSRECVCNYFVVKPPQFDTDTDNYSENDLNGTSSNANAAEQSHVTDVVPVAISPVVSSPESLFTLCFCVLKSQLHDDLNQFKEVNDKIRNELTDEQNEPVTLEGQNETVNLEDQNIPVSLFRLCLKTLTDSMTPEPLTPETLAISSEMVQEPSSNKIQLTVPSLNTLCYRTIVTLLADASDQVCEEKKESYVNITSCTEDSNDSWLSSNQDYILPLENNNKLKSLFSLCVEYIQKIQKYVEINKSNILTPQSLKYITFENVKNLLYASDTVDHHEDETAIEGLMMINCVNTLSEEAFLNLEQCDTDMPDSSEYPDDYDNDDHFEPELTDGEDDLAQPSWASQVQMQELRSCVNNTDVEEPQEPQEMDSIIAQIKIEPLDDATDNALDLARVKSEPMPGPDEMTIIPGVKPEIEELPAPVQRHSSGNFDMDSFEHFASSSKLMRALTEHDSEEIYSQSSERVRRQHEPDYYEENTDALGLLVPHTYEPMVIQTAKGSLMQSSSDESTTNSKNTSKKVKRKGRPKKSEQKVNSKNVALASVPTPVTKEKDKTINNKQIPAPAPVTKEKEKASNNKNIPLATKEKTSNNEVAILTRRMKEKIRQEEKKDESTDSESETVPIRLRSRDKKDTTQTSSELVKDKPKPATIAETIRDKSKPATAAETIKDKSKPATRSEPVKEKSKPAASNKSKSNEIQCNNVDSTDQIQLEDNVPSFSGFTSIETNEMSNYEKYMKFVYDKVIPGKEEEILKAEAAVKESLNEESKDSLISPDEPIELLECEPTMPIFDDDVDLKVPKGPKATKSKITKAEVTLPAAPKPPKFIDRYGWECYPVDSSDAKLYQNTSIFLEKLPESFVQTYFEYQNISVKDKSDEEINRLTNLTSLNRSTSIREKKVQNSSKKSARGEKSGNASRENSRPGSAMMDSDHYDELMPSDDEGPRVEDEEPQPVVRHTDNTLAKNSLMDENESDNENSPVKIKKEVDEGDIRPNKPGPKSKKKPVVVKQEGTDLMLTADKMMNKELTLLHAPVVMNDSVKDVPAKGTNTRQSKKSGTKVSPTNNKDKADEDSSSEEEKQWVSTKEKLLKRMGKKETASADDAKRAKLVSEFIERREGNPGLRKRGGGKPRRSGKKFLEREKQLRVLQRELFGEETNDPTVGKRSGAAWKGRRNIRKVLDKKSLARSTVIANMEEFERKRRLNVRTTRLRELLGCEEGVNVLVINDEVCLEYDFEEHRPVVTIHPFFTRVMKAHQYEGVKFMWDACFESLTDIEQGHPGGGCILAHCMGLGKTLQVLALLHTVLTHPRVGMQRVLVCCPLSTVLNWVDEIHKWIGPVTNQIKVFELSKLKKTYERAYQLEDWYSGGGIFIIGYELFRSLSTLDPEYDDIRPTIVNKIRSALLDPGPDIVVCDEGHLLKNDCSVLAVAMSRVVTKRRIVLTGTPMQNNLREYYCMVNFVKPNLLGTYAEYSNRFENPIMNGQHRDSVVEDIKLMKARTHILHKVLEGCLQRQEASVLYPYLPKKHEYTVFITLTKCQWDLYKHYLNHYSRQMNKTSVLKDFHILQKIWSHPQVLHNFQTKAQENRNKIKLEKLEDDLAAEDHEDLKDDVVTDLWWLQYLEGGDMLETLESSNKFMVVFRILDECVALGDKVLIFSTSLFCLDAMEYFLKKINKWSLGQEYYRLDGSVPAEVRQKWCREFNADTNVNTKLFLVSTRAGCLGLNMTAANRVIIMDTSWNPAHDIQSIFRVYRFGQKKDCYIYRLVAMGTMEQKIYERSVTKQAVACRVVDEQQIDRHYNMAELTELYRYDEAGASVAGGVAVGVCDVALLRVARHAALHAVHEHDSLLRSSEQGLNETERDAAWMQFQQEQAHKQMENKLITNIPKISLKRIQGGHNYTQSYDLDNIKTEIKNEATSEDFVKPEVKKRGRGKKYLKNQIVPESIAGPTVPENSQDVFQGPGTSKGPRQYMDQKHYEDETMVHKITEILMQHDFQSRKGSTEIANLVAKVRKIVKQGYIYQGDTDDPLTASIAKVLLPKRMTMPVLTDIMCESINKSVTSVPFQPESILSTPANDRKTRAESRNKRKAALAAEKHIDSISQDVIILDDDADNTDEDFVPDAIDKPDKQTKRKGTKEPSPQQVDLESSTSPPSPSRSFEDDDEPSPFVDDDYVEIEPDDTPTPAPKPKVGPKAFKEKLQRKYKEMTKNMMEPAAEPPTSNISDDDEPLSKQRSVPTSNKVDSPVATVEDEEMVPLPLSLLSNKNFINIVAHTYLNGNPMLDADAATLAAQYSTFKSLKEAEESGKNITSGPIYDIAVKVIGKTLFKRMNGVSVKSNMVVDAANVSIELKEKMRLLDDHASEDTPGPKSRTKRKAKQIERSDSNEMLDSSQTTANHSRNSNVVPVGLIQSANRIPNAVEFTDSECILPDGDDDDCRIMPPAQHLPAPPPLHPAPRTHRQRSAAPPSAANPSPPVSLGDILAAKKRTSDAYLSAPVSSAPIPLPAPPSQPHIKINKGKIIITPTSMMGESHCQVIATAPKSFSDQQSAHATICLDSDDEEPSPPKPPAIPLPAPPAPAPVPISLTVGPSPDNRLPKTLNLAPMIAGPMSKPLILRQVTAGAGPKFVLVSNTSAAPSTTVASTHSKKPVVSVPQSAPAPTQSIEPILSTGSPTATYMNKLKQARCKPGDIIKISDKGEIEVLQVNKLNKIGVSSIGPSTSGVKTYGGPSKVTKSKPGPSRFTNPKPSTSEVPKSQASYSVDTKQKTPQKEDTSSKPKPGPSRARTMSISSSSSDSRPSSPVDTNPLSILKNVVHIQAADDTPGTSIGNKNVTTVKSQKTTPAPKTTLQAKHDSLYKTIKSKTEPTSGSSILKNTDSKNSKVFSSVSSIGKYSDSKTVKVPSSSSNVSKNSDTKTSKVLNDLMQKKSLSLKSTKTPEKKSSTSTITKTVAIAPKTSSQAKPQFATVKAGSGASMLKTKIEVKKRVSTAADTASTPPKKKMMTLKDFNIDDIDDIIELD